MLDAFLPLCTFESKEGFSVALGNRRQLEKIASNNQLWNRNINLDHTIRGRWRGGPVCHQMAVPCSSVDFEQLTTKCRTSVHRP